MLGRRAQGRVDSKDVAWEPGRGLVTESLCGRRVLFLAAHGPSGERDLYRALVRVTPEGQPVEAVEVTNLTETPLGDDAGLEVRGHSAAFATTAFGRVQGVTVLDLNGVPSATRPASIVGRVLLALSSLHRTGSLVGIGRTDVVFDAPVRAARLVLSPPRLEVDVEAPSDSIVLDLDTGVLAGRPGEGESRGPRVVRQDYRGRNSIAWSVDIARSALGASPIAWVERLLFGARDLMKRAGSKAFGWSGESRLKKGAPAPAAHVLTPAELSGVDTGWPPAPIPSLWEIPKPGEGRWAAVSRPYLPRPPSEAGDAAPAYFYTTFIRPDPDRPYTEVLLIAMDMRQLELGMEGGYEEPEPLVGPPGTGKIPRDRAVLPRVVAAFNGAFKAEHGEYGMMVNRRILLPPLPGAATVVVTRQGTGFGTWPASKEIPGDVVSFRQNLDPLVDGSVVNPAGRNVWGWQIAGETSLTERTALCLTPAGHVYFAWGRDITGGRLARALKQAGCDYAMHLDMNPRHCGFVFMHATSADPKEGHFELADSGMSVSPSRYLIGSDKDFFYVMLRSSAPDDASAAAWSPSPGAQPPPTWIPAVSEAHEELGELDVRVVGFEAGRVDWIVRAGTEEPSSGGARPKKIGLEPELEGRVVAAVGLGHTTDALRYGLSFDGAASLDLRQTYATVALAPGRAPRIIPPGARPLLSKTEEAVQLPLLAEGGVVDTRASDRGGLRLRGAMCVTDSGRVLVAVGRHDSSDPLASTLVLSGCRRVVGLDRGSRHAAFVSRAGTADAPRSHYETSVLYALARPMTPHTFRFPSATDAPFDAPVLTPPLAPASP
jgi:hypothetical protein